MSLRYIPAEIVRISDILKGDFESLELDHMRFFRLPWCSTTRLRIMGVVVSSYLSQDRNFARVSLFDGTGTVDVRAFDEGVPLLLDKESGDVYHIGAILDVIGRPRSWREEIYLQPITVVRIKDPNVIILRSLELLILDLRRIPMMIGQGRNSEGKRLNKNKTY